MKGFCFLLGTKNSFYHLVNAAGHNAAIMPPAIYRHIYGLEAEKEIGKLWHLMHFPFGQCLVVMPPGWF